MWREFVKKSLRKYNYINNSVFSFVYPLSLLLPSSVSPFILSKYFGLALYRNAKQHLWETNIKGTTKHYTHTHSPTYSHKLQQPPTHTLSGNYPVSGFCFISFLESLSICSPLFAPKASAELNQADHAWLTPPRAWLSMWKILYTHCSGITGKKMWNGKWFLPGTVGEEILYVIYHFQRNMVAWCHQ